LLIGYNILKVNDDDKALIICNIKLEITLKFFKFNELNIVDDDFVVAELRCQVFIAIR
jgi:hypothetical protein